MADPEAENGWVVVTTRNTASEIWHGKHEQKLTFGGLTAQ